MAATFIITFKVAEGTDSTFVTSTKRAELAEADALNQFRAIDRFKDVEIDALETYVFEMLETEKKVDTYLKYMEEYK